MVEFLLISSKFDALNLLKMEVFWSKGYEIIISVYDVANEILSRELNHIAEVIMWPKFGSSSISMREVIMTSIL